MKIVLTGGPSAGKTSIVEILYRSDVEQMAIVEEAASILYRGGFPRSPHVEAVRSQQCAIYAVQTALEEISEIISPHRTLLCDRGSLDGLAYWPGTEESFFERVHSSMDREIERYDWVIHLDSASGLNYKTSRVRLEKSEDAAKINDLVKFAWRLHPQRLFIPGYEDFNDKISMVLNCLSLIQSGKSGSDIRSLLGL